jgi:ATP-dependent Lon protease
VVIKNPAVVAAIKEMMKRGQPYLGAFLLKEKPSSSSASASVSSTDSEHTEDDINVIRARLAKEEEDKDVIDSLDEVHDVGVFCQVTSVFAAATPSSAKDGTLSLLLCRLRGLIMLQVNYQAHQAAHPHPSKKR